MQISSTPTAYGGSEAQRLLNMLLQPQQPPSGQDLPSGDSTTATPAATTPAASQPTSTPSAAQFATNTLASLLSAQEAPPSSANVASQIMGVADSDGDGSLSLSEVEKALGADTTTGADASSNANPLAQAFASIDTNGDGQVSAGELTNALDAQKATQGAHHGHHGHHAHMAQQAPANSSDLASQLLGSADSDGDGQLSLTELENALGTSASNSASDMLTAAIGKLDTNGDGQLSQTELTAGIDAFRAAHHRGGAQTAQSQSAQTVTA
jgi:Ca2+-binding EF-hand superfamily protein